MKFEYIVKQKCLEQIGEKLKHSIIILNLSEMKVKIFEQIIRHIQSRLHCFGKRWLKFNEGIVEIIHIE